MIQNIKSSDEDIMLQFKKACLSGGEDMFDKFVQEHGKKILYVRDEAERTPLMWVSRQGVTEILWKIMEYDTNKSFVNDRDIDRNTALTFASEAGQTECTAILIALEAEVDAQNNKGQTPIMLALRNGHIEVADLLISNKAKTELRDKAERTTLMCAVLSCNLETVEYALGIETIASAINEQENNVQYTVLMVAIAACHQKIVKLILASNPELKKRNHNGQTALQLAKEWLINTKKSYSLYIPGYAEKSTEMENAKKRMDDYQEIVNLIQNAENMQKQQPSMSILALTTTK